MANSITTAAIKKAFDTNQLKILADKAKNPAVKQAANDRQNELANIFQGGFNGNPFASSDQNNSDNIFQQKQKQNKENNLFKPVEATQGQVTDSLGNPIDLSRPRIHNSDGSISTEKSITVSGSDLGLAGDRATHYFNLPSIKDGAFLTPEQALDEAKKGNIKITSEFNDLTTANNAAVARSSDIGKLLKAEQDQKKQNEPVFNPGSKEDKVQQAAITKQDKLRKISGGRIPEVSALDTLQNNINKSDLNNTGIPVLSKQDKTKPIISTDISPATNTDTTTPVTAIAPGKNAPPKPKQNLTHEDATAITKRNIYDRIISPEKELTVADVYAEFDKKYAAEQAAEIARFDKILTDSKTINPNDFTSPRNIPEIIADTLESVTTGVIDLVDVPVGLANILTGGGIDKITKFFGAKTTYAQESALLKEYIGSFNSHTLQVANARVAQLNEKSSAENAKKYAGHPIKEFLANFIDAVGIIASNPAVAGDQIARSIPNLVAAILTGGGAAALGAKATLREAAAKKLIARKILSNETKIARKGLNKNLGKTTLDTVGNGASEAAQKATLTTAINKNLIGKAKLSVFEQAGKNVLKKNAIKDVGKISDRKAKRAVLGFVGVTEGVSNAQTVKVDILNTDFKELEKSSPKYNILLNSGLSPEQARTKLATEAQRIAFTIAATTGLAAAVVTGSAAFESALFRHKIINPGIKKVNAGLLRKTNHALIVNPLKTFAKGAAPEGAEETLQGATGQLATNIASNKALGQDKDILAGVAASAAQGLIVGVGSGGGIANISNTLGGTVRFIATSGKSITRKLSDTTGKFKDAKKVIAAVASDNIVDITNVERPDYNPENAIDAITQTLPDISNGTPESNVEYDNRLVELKTHINNLTGIAIQLSTEIANSDNTKAAFEQNKIKEKEVARISKVVVAANEKLTALATTSALSSEEITAAIAEITTLLQGNKESQQQGNDAVDNLLRSAPSLNDEQLDAIEKAGKLDNNNRARTTAYHTKNAAISKATNIADVHQEILNGGIDANTGIPITGINQHLANIALSIRTNNEKNAYIAVGAFKVFAESHARKLAAFKKALKGDKAAITQLKNAYGLSILPGKRSQGLFNAIAAENKIFTAAAQQVNAEYETAFGKKHEINLKDIFKDSTVHSNTNSTFTKGNTTRAKGRRLTRAAYLKKIYSRNINKGKGKGKGKGKSTSKGKNRNTGTRTFDRLNSVTNAANAKPTADTPEGRTILIKELTKGIAEANAILNGDNKISGKTREKIVSDAKKANIFIAFIFDNATRKTIIKIDPTRTYDREIYVPYKTKGLRLTTEQANILRSYSVDVSLTVKNLMKAINAANIAALNFAFNKSNTAFKNKAKETKDSVSVALEKVNKEIKKVNNTNNNGDKISISEISLDDTDPTNITFEFPVVNSEKTNDTIKEPVVAVSSPEEIAAKNKALQETLRKKITNTINKLIANLQETDPNIKIRISHGTVDNEPKLLGLERTQNTVTIIINIDNIVEFYLNSASATPKLIPDSILASKKTKNTYLSNIDLKKLGIFIEEKGQVSAAIQLLLDFEIEKAKYILKENSKAKNKALASELLAKGLIPEELLANFAVTAIKNLLSDGNAQANLQSILKDTENKKHYSFIQSLFRNTVKLFNKAVAKDASEEEKFNLTLSDIFDISEKNSNNKLHTVQNLIERLDKKLNQPSTTTNDEEINAILAEFADSEEEKQILRQFIVFHNKFKNALSKSSAKHAAILLNNNNNPKFYLNDITKAFFKQGTTEGSDPTIDPNFITEAAYTAFNWFLTQGSATVTNDDEVINSILGDPSNTVPTRSAVNKLRHIGVPYSNLATQLGGQLIAALGIRIKNNQDNALKSRLVASLGTIILGGLLNMGDYAELQEVSSGDLAKLAANRTSFGDKKTTTFFRVKSETVGSAKKHKGKTVKSRRMLKVHDSLQDNRDISLPMLASLFHPALNQNLPTSRKPKATGKARSLGNSKTKSEKATTEAVETQESIAHTIHNITYNLFDSIGQTAQYLMLGAVPNIDEMSISTRESATSKNTKITDDVNTLKSLADNTEPNDKFYYLWKLFSNGRLGTLSSGVSIQASKIARAFIMPASHILSVNIGNNAEFNKFLQQIHILIGMDENTPASIAQITKYIKSNPALNKGVNELIERHRELKNGFSVVTTEESDQLILDAVAFIYASGDEAAAFAALAEWVNYLDTVNNKQSTFTTAITTEYDAKTSGVALSTGQFIPNGVRATRTLLARTGIFLKNSLKTLLGDELDTYEYVAKIWADKLDTRRATMPENSAKYRQFQAIDNLVGSMTDESGSEILSNGRSLAKPVVTMLNYGAGLPSIIRSIGINTVKLYQDKINEILMLGTDSTEVVTKYNELVKITNDLFGGKVPNLVETETMNQDSLDKLRKFDIFFKIKGDPNSSIEGKIMQLVNEFYGKELKAAIENDPTLSQLIKARKESATLFNYATMMYKHIFAHEVAKFSKDTNKTELSKNDLDKILKKLAESNVRNSVETINGNRVPIAKRVSGANIKNNTTVKAKTVISGSNKNQSISNTQNIKGEELKNLATTQLIDKLIENSLGASIATTINIEEAIMAEIILQAKEEGIEIGSLFDAVLVNLKDSDRIFEISNKIVLSMLPKMSANKNIITEIENLKAYIENNANEFTDEEKKAFAKKLNILMEFTPKKDQTIEQFLTKKKSDELFNEENRKELLKDLNGAVSTHMNTAGANIINNNNTVTTDTLEDIITEEEETAIIDDAVQKGVDDIINTEAEKPGITLKANPATDETPQGDFFGSTDSGINPNTFIADTELQINTASAAGIFLALGRTGNKKETTRHANHLRELLHSTIINVLNPLILKIKNAGTESIGAIQGKQLFLVSPNKGTANAISMSDQETYVHELVHAISREAIDNNFNLAEQVRALFNEVEALTEPKDFLNDPADINDPAEMALATERYNHIFRNSVDKSFTYKNEYTGATFTSSKNAYLHEFIASANTNAQFMRHLETIFAKNSKNKNKDDNTKLNYAEKISRMLAKIYKYFTELFSGTLNKNAAVRARILLEQLANVDEEKKSILTHYFPTLETFEEGTKKLISNFVVAPIVKFSQTSLVKNSKSKAVQGLSKIIPRLPSSSFKEWYKLIQIVRRRQGKSASSFLDSMLREIAGPTAETAVWHAMTSWANKELDQTRRTISQITSNEIVKSFGVEGYTETESVAMHKVLLKADVAALYKVYSPDDLRELIKNPKFVAKQIRETLKELNQFGDNKHYYKKMAKSLANYMITGNITETNTSLNTRGIAQFFGIDLKNIPVKLTERKINKAEIILEKLVSLYALTKISNVTKSKVATVMDREYTKNTVDNGITFALQSMVKIKENSLAQLFDDNKAITIKGFTKETFDPRIDTKIGTFAQKAIMEANGFKLHHRITPDNTIPNQFAGYYLYVNENSGLDTRVSGIASTTNETNKGATILQMKKQIDIEAGPRDVAPTINEIRKTKDKEQLDIISSRDTSHADNLLIPIYNGFGEIKDFRYTMTEHNKNTILGKNNILEDTIGSMEASITDKLNGYDVNKKIIDQAYLEFKNEFKSNPQKFVFISPTSTNAVHREIYRLFPKISRNYAKNKFGLPGFYIKDEVVRLIFGFKKIGVNDLAQGFEQLGKSRNQLLNHAGEVAAKLMGLPKTRIGFNVWTDIMKNVRDAIVIKMLPTARNNIISNTLVLLVQGISPIDIAKNHSIGIRASKLYLKDLEEKLQIEQNLATREILNTRSPHFDVTKYKDAKVKLSRVKTRLANSPVRDLHESGVYQSIIEDIKESDDKNKYKDHLSNYIDPITSKIPKGIKTVTKHLFLTHDTPAYKALRTTTQLSDFVARFVMHQHNIKTLGMNKENSIKKILESFIVYDIPTHPYVQFANDMGAFMFTKFLFRIQRVIYQNVKKNPGKMGALVLLQSLFGDVPDIADSFIPTSGTTSQATLNPVEILKALGKTSPINTIFRQF